MRLINIFLLVTLIAIDISAQSADMYDYWLKLGKNISVGSSPTEVKAILGKPFAVLGGFPKFEGIVLVSDPEHVGQLNNSTWYYRLAPKYFKNVEDTYSINGSYVDEYTFSKYENFEKVYFLNKRIVTPEVAEAYMMYNKDDIKIERLDPAQKITLKAKVRKKYIPVICIVFDKGTQVVADINKFLLLAD